MPTTTRTRKLTGTMSERLRASREAAGLSRRQLADAIGISERAVNYYENPNYARARKSYIIREWATVTNRNFEELWGTRDQPFDRTGWFNRTPVSATCAA